MQYIWWLNADWRIQPRANIKCTSKDTHLSLLLRRFAKLLYMHEVNLYQTIRKVPDQKFKTIRKVSERIVKKKKMS